MNKISLILKTLILSFLLAFFVSPTFAVSKSGKATGRPTFAATNSGTARACLARESAVKTRMTQLTRLVTTMEATFDKIAGRVETYYTDTVLSSGRSVANYAALVSDIAAKKTLVQVQIDKANADITSFSCTSGDPKVVMNRFRLNLQSVKSALKDYRTSVKNLIVAVRTVSKGMEATPTETD